MFGPFEFSLQAGNLSAEVGFFFALRFRFAELLDPVIKALVGDTQSLADFEYRVAVNNHLVDGFLF